MIINHNIDAMISYNKSNAAEKTKADAMKKLASGLKINTASDDAAGSTISQKMKGQIRGLRILLMDHYQEKLILNLKDYQILQEEAILMFMEHSQHN